MSAVRVQYGHSIFKYTATPSTLLNDVLVKAMVHFKLSSDTHTWFLKYGEKDLTLFLPYNQLNLPTGCVLQLGSILKDETNVNGKELSIKFQAMGIGAHIRKINTNFNIADTVKEVCEAENWNMQPLSQVSISLFSKNILFEELKGMSFEDLGVNNGVMIRLKLPKSVNSPKVSNESNIASCAINDLEWRKICDTSSKEDKTEVSESPKRQIHKVYAYAPAISSRGTTSQSTSVKEESDDSDYDLSEGDILKYQSMLSKRAMTGPLMTKRLREQLDARETRKVEICTIRVKFPDLTHLESSFAKDETMEDVYKLVSLNLIDSDIEFTLVQSHPPVVLEKASLKLVEHLNFGSNTLLLFKTKNPPPYLKKSILDSAKTITSASNNDVSSANTMVEHQKLTFNSGEQMSIKKVPKWMKLSKN
ncbi:Ubx4p Ecym_3410 [Eremothecium cymbalariae DBVPG|uniref:UBX domain-containing protein n=1 Tax=Eremothecium cymbalariae (strain CBS 270.75 / DBVPG 7215 / KCTC 17166 / NRRL Y-17582) TaxID=931890 RepID=G8JRX7_ERECY|nr:Hypothetical protein Ecym_3410 [Eremothecium cymbalariae DBVPG\